MKYQRSVNRRVDAAASPATGDDCDPALAAQSQCWPTLDDDPLPRVVQRGGQAVIDEGWVVIEDGSEDTADSRL